MKNIYEQLLLCAIIYLRKQHFIFLVLFVIFAWLLSMNKKWCYCLSKTTMFSQQNFFIDLLMLMSNRRLPLIIKVTLISILILKAIGSTAIGAMEFRRHFCHSKISLICFIYLSFPNLFLYH